MICNFMLQHPDKAKTHFVEKVLKSLKGVSEKSINKQFQFEDLDEFVPKHHTLRKGNRWRKDMIIHFYINARQKGATEFAKSSCTLVQNTYMKFQRDINLLEVWIDGHKLSPHNINFLIINDGLTYRRFVEFFFPLSYNLQEWEGQLIHWTKLKYPISGKASPSGRYIALSQVPYDQKEVFFNYLENNPSISVSGIKGVSYEHYSAWYDEWIRQRKH